MARKTIKIYHCKAKPANLLEKDSQKIWSKDLLHEEPFGYRDAHHGYLLTSCPGHSRQNSKKMYSYISLTRLNIFFNN